MNFCQTFYSYVNDEQKTKDGYTDDGYWKSGDLATIPEDGTLKCVFFLFLIINHIIINNLRIELLDGQRI